MPDSTQPEVFDRHRNRAVALAAPTRDGRIEAHARTLAKLEAAETKLAEAATEIKHAYRESLGECVSGSWFMCARCRAMKPASQGAGDDWPGLCDTCWCAVERTVSAPHRLSEAEVEALEIRLIGANADLALARSLTSENLRGEISEANVEITRIASANAELVSQVHTLAQQLDKAQDAERDAIKRPCECVAPISFTDRGRQGTCTECGAEGWTSATPLTSNLSAWADALARVTKERDGAKAGFESMERGRDYYSSMWCKVRSELDDARTEWSIALMSCRRERDAAISERDASQTEPPHLPSLTGRPAMVAAFVEQVLSASSPLTVDGYVQALAAALPLAFPEKTSDPSESQRLALELVDLRFARVEQARALADLATATAALEGARAAADESTATLVTERKHAASLLRIVSPLGYPRPWEARQGRLYDAEGLAIHADAEPGLCDFVNAAAERAKEQT